MDKNSFIQQMSFLRAEVPEYGYCFDDYFTLKLSKRYRTHLPNTFSEIIRYVFGMVTFTFNVVCHRQTQVTLPRFVFTLISPKPHLRALLEKTIAHLPKKQCAIFQFSGKPTSTICPVIRGSENLFRIARLMDCGSPIIDFFKVWKLLGEYEPAMPLRFRFVVSAGVLGIHLRATVAYEAYKRLLADSKVEALIVEYDHNARCLPFVLAARDSGKETYTFQHGLINSPGGYDPVIADKILVWGDFFRDTLVEYGVPVEKIIVTGCQSIDESKLSNKPDDVVKVIYATTAYTNQENRQLAAGIEQAMAKLPEFDFELVVKAHPSDCLDYALDNRAPEEVVSLPTLDSLPWCDVLICHNTTIALDALRMGKLVLLIDWIERPLSETVQRLVDEKCCLAIQSPDELGDCLRRYSSGDDNLEQTRARGTSYAKRCYEAIGDAAGANAARAILEAV